MDGFVMCMTAIVYSAAKLGHHGEKFGLAGQ